MEGNGGTTSVVGVFLSRVLRGCKGRGRRAAFLVLFTFAMGVFLRLIDPAAPTAAEGVKNDPDALAALSKALSALRADPESIELIREWFKSEEARTTADLLNIESNLDRLQTEIQIAEDKVAQIHQRLDAIAVAKILLRPSAQPVDVAKADSPAASEPSNENQDPKSVTQTAGITTQAAHGEAIPAIDRQVDFQSEIYPIFERSCFECHGPEKQRSQLRLDARQVVLNGGSSGPSIVPGDGENSLLFKRIAGIGDDEQMPPTDKKLSGEEIGLIRAWIDQGGNWPKGLGSDAIVVAKHWAYEKPVRPEIPAVEQADWIRNPIDRFILARIEKEGLEPSPDGSRETLIRRVSLDLIGLPPTVREVEAFLADDSPDAYENLVDRLLSSPHYGERWARLWLDLARYADTNGYEKDRPRSMWPWRDWVIWAFNENMPFDQFTIEQIAGDLLPDPSRDQLVATGFHRNTMLNDEGGIDPEEFRIVAVKDRVDTTGAVWLGTTLHCAQCHDHKYDPFSQKEYYQFLAFFNSTKDMGVGQEPELSLPTQEESATKKLLEKEIAELELTLNVGTPELERAQTKWEEKIREEALPDWTPLDPLRYASTEGSILAQLEDRSLLAVGENPNNDAYEVTYEVPFDAISALKLEVLTHSSLPNGGPGRAPNAAFVLHKMAVSLESKEQGNEPEPIRFKSAVADHTEPGYEVGNLVGLGNDRGWSIDSSREENRVDRNAIFQVEEGTRIPTGSRLNFRFSHQYGRNHNLGRFRISVTASKNPLGPELLPLDLQPILATAPDARDATASAKLAAHFRSITPLLAETRYRLEEARTELAELDIPITMVMEELSEPRDTHVLKRGNFLTPGKEVNAGVPAALHSFSEDAPKNRLSLAKWLVDRDNPLTARVLVNRIWAAYFGRGLVKTSEDFGTQGDPPTHPALLDWLAVELMESGWNLKEFHKLIVMSSTYRQSSSVTPLILEKDPNNLLYARGPRFRMEAEMVRDNALAAAGLLNRKIGGMSVFPPQPEGIWNTSFTVHDTDDRWIEADDANRYRRGLYTYIRRTAPYPTLTMFDAPTRDVCTVERSRTNTPLQALATLNDPGFVEAAGALAKRVLEEGGESLADRIRYAYRRVLARFPSESEMETQKDLYQKAYARYSTNSEAAGDFIVFCRQDCDGFDPAEMASWALLSNVLLNLDETVTKG